MSDRTLFEIVEAAKDGEKPTHDECYWAMLALSALLHFDSRALRNQAFSNTKVPLKMESEESFRRHKSAFQTPPQRYVGASNNPANPEYQTMRRMAFKVFEKATGEKLR